MHAAVRAAYADELRLAGDARRSGALAAAFAHLERAHILGQRRMWRHVRSHLGMPRIGWRRRDAREVAGQLTRLVAPALFSRIRVPAGNTGGANVSAMKPMPVAEDLRRLLDPSGKVAHVIGASRARAPRAPRHDRGDGCE